MADEHKKKVRVCGDYKVTVNPQLHINQYPLPTPQDLFSNLSGKNYFSKIDLKQAYQQMEVTEESKEFLTINTHKGLYQMNRLAFGVASAPAIFQSAMDTVLQGIPGTLCYIDDILITSEDEAQHIVLLRQVLKRLEDHGLTVKKEKCQFMVQKITYLGHTIDKKGIHPTHDKVEAIMKASSPADLSQLRSFLGLVQYYSKFLPNLSTVMEPLHHLLRGKEPWKWTCECEAAFIKVKQMLISPPVLAHYNVSKPIKVACDASQYGVGGVLSIMTEEGERPVAYVSRSLTASERNYSQIEKEALAIIYTVDRLNQYIYGRPFVLVTDHKPLVTIFGPKKGIPPVAAARIQRWALKLSGYQYTIEYKNTHDHANADALSRLLPAAQKEKQANAEPQFFHTVLEELPITPEEVRKNTSKDPVLSKVLDRVLHGWPAQERDPELQSYHRIRNELTQEAGCLIWGTRVVIPPKLRARILNELHEAHPGIVRMKLLARSYVWWPRLDDDIGMQVHDCTECSMVQRQAPTLALHPWKWCIRPFQRIHIDYAEYQGVYYLVTVDSYSKWPEIIAMKNMTTVATINAMRMMFARFGLPEEVVSDNGPQFTAEDFAVFLTENGVKHTRTPRYHPASNGLAERMVQELKMALKKGQLLARFLMAYRNTPHTTTGRSPAELFLKRQPRTRLSMVKPNLAEHVEKRQEKATDFHDRGTKTVRTFTPSDVVLVRNFRGSNKWIPATVLQRQGPATYIVRHGYREFAVHVDHIIRAPQNQPEVRPEEREIEPDLIPDVPVPVARNDDRPPGTPEDITNSGGSASESKVPQSTSAADPRVEFPSSPNKQAKPAVGSPGGTPSRRGRPLTHSPHTQVTRYGRVVRAPNKYSE